MSDFSRVLNIIFVFEMRRFRRADNALVLMVRVPSGKSSSQSLYYAIQYRLIQAGRLNTYEDSLWSRTKLAIIPSQGDPRYFSYRIRQMHGLAQRINGGL